MLMLFLFSLAAACGPSSLPGDDAGDSDSGKDAYEDDNSDDGTGDCPEWDCPECEKPKYEKPDYEKPDCEKPDCEKHKCDCSFEIAKLRNELLAKIGIEIDEAKAILRAEMADLETAIYLALAELEAKIPQKVVAFYFSDLDTLYPLGDGVHEPIGEKLVVEEGTYQVKAQVMVYDPETVSTSITCELRHNDQRFSVANAGLGTEPFRSGDRQVLTLVGVVEDVMEGDEIWLGCRNFNEPGEGFATDFNIVATKIEEAFLEEDHDD